MVEHESLGKWDLLVLMRKSEVIAWNLSNEGQSPLNKLKTVSSGHAMEIGTVLHACNSCASMILAHRGSHALLHFEPIKGAFPMLKKRVYCPPPPLLLTCFFLVRYGLSLSLSILFPFTRSTHCALCTLLVSMSMMHADLPVRPNYLSRINASFISDCYSQRAETRYSCSFVLLLSTPARRTIPLLAAAQAPWRHFWVLRISLPCQLLLPLISVGLG